MDWSLCACILLLPATLSVPDSLPDYVPPYGEKLKPKPFHYEYGAQAQDTNFLKKETQDDQGNVLGEVIVSLPDGRIQTTNYNAHYFDGYVADVKYAGTPTYPPQQHKNYDGPKFIPVHLKARPPFKNLPAPTKSKFHNFPLRNQDIRAETFKPALQTQGKSQKIRFESERTNSINLQKGINRTPSKEESLTEMMARIREDLKTVKPKKQNTNSPPQNKFNNQFPKTVEKSQDSMAEIMKKVREDLKKLEKLKVNPIEHQPTTFQNTHSTNNKKMKDMIQKMRENIATQERPPMMKIKSHVMPAGTKDKMAAIIKQMSENKKMKPPMMSIKSHVVTPMSVMSHVLSTPAPAESMAEIMKKIREDLKKTDKVELPPPVMEIKSHVKSQPEETENMKDIVQAIRNDLKKNEKLTIEGKMEKIKHIPTKKPLKESVIDFMKKIELMKKKEENPSIMSVKSRVIQQTNQDGDGNISMKIISHVIPENPKLF